MSSSQFRQQGDRRIWPLMVAAAMIGGLGVASAADLTVTPEQRSTAERVAQSGVPLSELAPNAPDSHTVQRGDTLWDISKLFLKSPWRWPELWGMNRDQIRNPHLIYPGQLLVLTKVDGRAMLRVGQQVLAPGEAPKNTVKLSPRIRSQVLDSGAISSIPLQIIGPFLNEAIILNADELASAPRIVATQEGRVMVSRGETAYVRGDLKGARAFRLFRESKPLLDPETSTVLGFEAQFVGTAEFTRAGEMRTTADGKAAAEVPASFVVTGTRLDAGVGDRLAPVPQRDFSAYAPHPPSQPIMGQIISIYGEALTGGQNQIVSINRGARQGVERGHVLALWRDGALTVDKTDERKSAIKLPDERIGLLFVFRVFDNVSYALIVSALDPVHRGDRFTQP
jgi:LysM repeat protein